MNENTKTEIICFQGNLRFLTPVHIGNGEVNELTDATLLRSEDARPFLPGTSLAGQLRHTATKLAPWLGRENHCKRLELDNGEGLCSCIVCGLFGSTNNGAKQEEITASKLWVYDGELSLAPKDTNISIRDYVGIDRMTGTAAKTAKFDLEVLNDGAVFKVRFRAENLTEKEKQLLAVVFNEWQQERGYLGAKKSSGFGNFILENLEMTCWDLSDEKQLSDYLFSDNHWEDKLLTKDWLNGYLGKSVDLIKKAVQHDSDVSSYAAHDYFKFKFEICFKDAFLTNDAMTAILLGFDHAPSFKFIDKKPSGAILPGSSLRGVLRSQCERILRTIATENLLKKYKHENHNICIEEFAKQCPACNPFSRDEDLTDSLTACDVYFEETNWQEKDGFENMCLICRLFGSNILGSRLMISDACETKQSLIKKHDFLAIDRFTGGGKDGAKFDALTLWQPIMKATLYLENPSLWELALLFLALRDMEDLAGLGFGTTKGFGQFSFGNWEIEHGWLNRQKRGLLETKPQTEEFYQKEIIKSSGRLDANAQIITLVNIGIKQLNEILPANRRKIKGTIKDTYFGSKTQSTIPNNN